MGDLLVRDLPEDVHEELRRRAAAAGRSLQAHVADLLTRSTARPTVAEWVASLEDLPRFPDISHDSVLHAVRGDEA